MRVSLSFLGASKVCFSSYFTSHPGGIHDSDVEGTELLIDLGKITPSMMKIMVTGYASLDNAVDS
ncbi:MAG TPA: hypothetical protein VEG31_04090, partial [Thermoproteota archaeon]|nr:hypothetical protein [Thermoproteota archaeon]